MRFFAFLFSIFIFACNQQAQDNNQPTNIETTISNLEQSDKMMKKNAPEFDEVIIDIVPDIERGTDEKSPTFIKNRLDALVGNFLKQKCTENQLKYPPKFILFRFFKYEKEFEVWAGNSNTDSLRRILLLPVCAVDDVPGTKLEEGDGKTPEGFYNTQLYYGSSADFMWIKLNNSEIATYGSVGVGSSFKMCLDYPNVLDLQKTKTIMKHNRPGSAICIHGNCVSIGCISFINRNYLPVFLASAGHDSKSFGPVKIHIFPFRFDNYTNEEKTSFAKGVVRMNTEQVLDIWNNLEQAYLLFNKSPRPIKIITTKNKYSYTYYK